MSVSEMSPTQFPLRVTAGRDDVITIFDGRGKIMARDVSVCQVSLPRGLYTVRAQYQDSVRDQVVRLEKPENLAVSAPRPFSAMPYFGSASAHEYYSYTSKDASLRDTRAPLGPPPRSSRLMVFARTVDKDSAQKESLLEGCSLLDHAGTLISRMGDNETKHDPSVGYATLSAAAPPGVYRLRYEDIESREVTIALFANWSTSCFILFRDTLRLDTMAMSIGDLNRGFDPDDRTATVIDLGLWSLQNGVTAFLRETMAELLAGKFTNPLSGLIGLHLVLRKPDTKPEQVAYPLGFLQQTLPDSADARALALIAAKKWPDHFKDDHRPLTTLPMLRASAEAIIEAAASDENLLPANSLITRAAPYRFCDSPWFMWDPKQLEPQRPMKKSAPRPTHLPMAGGNADMIAGYMTTDQFDFDVVPEEVIQAETLDWVDLGVFDLLKRSARTKQVEPPNIEWLARSLRLPAGTVKTHIKRLQRHADKEQLPESDDGPWPESVVRTLKDLSHPG